MNVSFFITNHADSIPLIYEFSLANTEQLERFLVPSD